MDVEAIARIADMPCAELQMFQGRDGQARLQTVQAQAKARQREGGWSEIGSQTGKDGHTTSILRGKIAGSDVQCIVATSVMNASPRSVYDLLVDNDRIREYNDMFSRYEVLEQVGPNAAIGWAGYKPVFPTSAREFVTITAWNEGEGGGTVTESGAEGPWWVIASKSLTSADSEAVGPPRRGFTRGTIECAGYATRWSPAFLEENGGVVPEEVAMKVEGKIVYALRGVRPGAQPRTVFTSICQSSPGGSVPISLVNSLAATAPYKVIKAIKKIAEA
jgi:hypothetical protein